MDDVFGFMSNSYGINHFSADLPFQAVLKHFLGRSPDYTELGEYTGRELLEITDYVDRIASPKHVMWGVNGERVDRVLLDPAQRSALVKLIRDFGINRPPYEGGSWHEHYAMGYLVGDPGLYCIITVTNQTAYGIYKYGSNEDRKLVRGLTGREDYPSFGATWFTEVQGGSDLGANVTRAFQKDGEWRISGDSKYFSSNAGLADMALVTARAEGAGAGAKGLSLFLVPRLRGDGSLNFRIRRLKEKSGTVNVPTGEAEFDNSGAVLLGKAEEGIYYTMENLMVSRLSNAIGAAGVSRKSYFETYNYVKKRSAFGRKLIEHPLVQRDLLDMEISIEGSLAIAFKAIDEFDRTWREVPPYSPEYHYARLLTHISKNITADHSAYVTRLAMELHGGIGFLSEFPVERWHREALITPIWEGPSNIQALDMLEAIYRKNAHELLVKDMEDIAGKMKRPNAASKDALSIIRESISTLDLLSDYEREFFAKDILNRLGHSVATIMLASIGNDEGNEKFLAVSSLYADKYLYERPLTLELIKGAMKIIEIEK